LTGKVKVKKEFRRQNPRRQEKGKGGKNGILEESAK
jgi:hypothetical protein